MDADDYWEGNFLADLAEFIFNNNNPDYILYKYKYYYHKNKYFKKVIFPFIWMNSRTKVDFMDKDVVSK